MNILDELEGDHAAVHDVHCRDEVTLVLASADQGFVLVADSLDPVFRDGSELFLEDIWLYLWVYQR